MRVCYSLLLLRRRRTALLFSSRLSLRKGRKNNTHMRDHIIELKREREMKSLVEDETPSVCTERAKRCIKIDRKKREDARRCRPPRERRGNTSPLLFSFITRGCAFFKRNERFDQKTRSVVLPRKKLESSSHMPLFSIY